MNEIKVKRIRKERRLKRGRKKIMVVNGMPRLSVFRSNNHIYAQIIDDAKGSTLVSASEKEIEGGAGKVNKALEVGRAIAKKALAKKVKKVVFDKGSYKYHGRVKALAEGARDEGLIF